MWLPIGGINVVAISFGESGDVLPNLVVKRLRERRCRRGERVAKSGVAKISLLLLLLMLFSDECFLSTLSMVPLRERRFSRGDPFLNDRRRGFGLVGGTIASFSGSK